MSDYNHPYDFPPNFLLDALHGQITDLFEVQMSSSKNYRKLLELKFEIRELEDTFNRPLDFSVFRRAEHETKSAHLIRLDGLVSASDAKKEEIYRKKLLYMKLKLSLNQQSSDTDSWAAVGKKLSNKYEFGDKPKKGRPQKRSNQSLNTKRRIAIDAIKNHFNANSNILTALIDSDFDLTDKEAIRIFRQELRTSKKNEPDGDNFFFLSMLDSELKLTTGSLESICKSVSTGRNSKFGTLNPYKTK